MKKALFATTALAVMSLGAVANAVDVELYGQVNKGVMMSDNGTKSTFNVVDNDFASTRLGVKGSQQLDNGMTASVLFEGEMQSNASDSIGMTEAQEIGGTGTPASFTERHARVGLAGKWGAVFVGHTSKATDKVAEQDLAGANDVLGSDIEDIGGGISFTGSGGTIAAETDNMDGDRDNLVRYDSPIFNGFQGRISVSQGSDVDAAVFYDGRYDALAIKAALGYTQNNGVAQADTLPGDNSIESTLVGSVSVKHDNGLGGTLAYGTQQLSDEAAGADKPKFMYAKVGYTWDAFEVAADYSTHKDIDRSVAAKTQVTYMGVAGQYNLGNGVSTAVYAKQFQYENANVADDDVNVYGVNMRVKF